MLPNVHEVREDLDLHPLSQRVTDQGVQIRMQRRFAADEERGQGTEVARLVDYSHPLRVAMLPCVPRGPLSA
jgi:hypothetical protein